jgi:agmatinase
MTAETQSINASNADPVALLGVPFDANASFLRGAAEAPARVRRELFSGASNLCAESGLDLSETSRFTVLDDLDPGTGADAFETVTAAVGRLLAQGIRPLVIGGDHSITFPILRAFRTHRPQPTILHIDAHPDLYDRYDGSALSHACPIARIMEAGLAARLIQIGVRTANPHQRLQAQRFGVECIEMSRWTGKLTLQPQGPLYLSVDMDAVDPAFAPGVSHPEPGGLTSRELIGLIQDLRAPIVGADLVEFNPRRDPLGITAALAAKLVKEIAAKMILSEAP